MFEIYKKTYTEFRSGFFLEQPDNCPCCKANYCPANYSRRPESATNARSTTNRAKGCQSRCSDRYATRYSTNGT
jgi:hypothetical protein